MTLVSEEISQQVTRDGRLDPLDRLDRTLARLGRLCPELPLLAIQWMTVKHPLLPLHESWLQQTRSRSRHERSQAFTEGIRWLIVLCAQGGKCFVHAIFLSVLLAWLRWRLRYALATLARQRFDLVAKSWSVDPTRLPEAGDFYFGDLQRRLAHRHYAMLLLCGDARAPIFGPRRWRTFADTHTRTGALPQLPELSLVSPRAPLRMAFQQVRTHLRLRRIALRSRHLSLRQLIESACRDCLSIQTTYNGLQFWVGQAVTRLWQPCALLTLYEGNSWERCLWWGAKTAEPSCRSVGYQHTILMPHNRTLLRPSSDDRGFARPDVVLCLGPRTRTLLQASHQRSTLISFGTFRQVPERGGTYQPRPSLRTVLVVLEGILADARLLFNTACRAAVACPEHRFIFRCHPVLPFDRVHPSLMRGLERIPNIEISSRSIEADCIRSSVVLYRGSSAVLYAILYGLKPIYLHDERVRDVDPLFELQTWRERACTRTLPTVLRQYAQEDREVTGASWRQAADYVEAYTVSASESAIDQFVHVLSFPAAQSQGVG